MHSMRYVIQFVAGTAGLLRPALAQHLPGLRITFDDDSAMIVESPAGPSDVAAIPLIKNAFVVVAESRRHSNLDKAAVHLSRVVGAADFPHIPGAGKRFRLAAHIDGALVSIDPSTRAALERAVAGRTGARLQPRGTCQEYWVIGRRGLPRLLFGARLPKPRQPATARGAISQELSAALVAASEPRPGDVFLDPFAGSGSFVTERLRQPVGQAWYSDLALDRHRKELPRRLTKDERVRLVSESALTLPSIGDHSIDVIVTDPPWGEYEAIDTDYETFAKAVSRSFARVLRPEHGRFVILVNRRNAALMRQALGAAGLLTRDMHEILVSGHPATVLVGRARPQPERV